MLPDHAQSPRIRVVRYDRERIESRDQVSVAELAALPHTEGVTWIEIEGFGSHELLAVLEKRFEYPRLALEDVVGNCARPKLEQFGEALFVTARAAKSGEHPEFEQVSLFMRGHELVTIVDEPLDVLAPLRTRLADASSLSRRSGVDFLLYRALDCIVDTYVPCLEHLGARLDQVETDAIARPSSKPLRTLYELMRDLRLLTRVALPMRDLAGALAHETKAHFRATTLPFVSDLRDHTQGVVELANHYRELGTDVRELVHGALNLRLNQVMRMMTAVTSIFIPLTFVTGVYGMNFDNMPELRWKYGYFVVLALVATIALFMLRWLRKQGWTRIGEE